MGAELRTSFKEKREGIEVGGNRNGAHLGKQNDSVEGRGEEGVSTNDGVIRKG